jgi:hypothetical protein
MSNVIRSPFQPVVREIIAKLVKAGYSHPAAHNHADAITNAISWMKHDLRSCGGREDGPMAAGASVTSDVAPFHECLSKRPAREIALSKLSATGFQCRPAPASSSEPSVVIPTLNLINKFKALNRHKKEPSAI